MIQEQREEIKERTELIETLWNVNEERHGIFIHMKIELIETLWNVNTIKIGTPTLA